MLTKTKKNYLKTIKEKITSSNNSFHVEHKEKNDLETNHSFSIPKNIQKDINEK